MRILHTLKFTALISYFFLLCGAGSTQAEDHLQPTGIKKGGVRKKLQNKHVQLAGEKVVLGTDELIAGWCVCV